MHVLPLLTTDLCSWGGRRKLWWAVNLINDGEWGGWLLCVCATAWYVHTCPWHYGLALNASSSRYTYMYTRGSWYPRVYILYVCFCSSKNCLHGRVIMCVCVCVGGWDGVIVFMCSSHVMYTYTKHWLKVCIRNQGEGGTHSPLPAPTSYARDI